MTKNENPMWSEEVTEHEKYHPPEGTFTKNASEVVRILLDGANGNVTQALRRLLFYMNRAGSKLSNAEELEKAKTKLEELEKK